MFNVAACLRAFEEELLRAESIFPKFPCDVVHAAAIVSEAAGELQQAALKFTYENGHYSAMRDEVIQVGAMALRFLVNFDDLRARRSPQVLNVCNR